MSNPGDSAAAPRLHLPDEPAHKVRWRDAAIGGTDLAEVVGGPGGIAEWLWQRWSVLRSAGMDAEALGAVVLGYRRELWLWLAGERTWVQCCAGLVGRLDRRLRVDNPAAAGQSIGTSRSLPVSTS